MGNRLSKLYTRTGDDGSTGLGDGTRIGKDSLRVTAYGSVDELNSVLGMVLADTSLPQELAATLQRIQHTLFDLGGELCIPGMALIEDPDIVWLEETIDRHNATLPPLKEFILPGGNLTAATCHLARTVCRRAERELIALHRAESIRTQTIRYLNRLSDLLFVVARVLARQHGHGEVLWQHQRRGKL